MPRSAVPAVSRLAVRSRSVRDRPDSGMARRGVIRGVVCGAVSVSGVSRNGSDSLAARGRRVVVGFGTGAARFSSSSCSVLRSDLAASATGLAGADLVVRDLSRLWPGRVFFAGFAVVVDGTASSVARPLLPVGAVLSAGFPVGSSAAAPSGQTVPVTVSRLQSRAGSAQCRERESDGLKGMQRIRRPGTAAYRDSDVAAEWDCGTLIGGIYGSGEGDHKGDSSGCAFRGDLRIRQRQTAAKTADRT